MKGQNSGASGGGFLEKKSNISVLFTPTRANGVDFVQQTQRKNSLKLQSFQDLCAAQRRSLSRENLSGKLDEKMPVHGRGNFNIRYTPSRTTFHCKDTNTSPARETYKMYDENELKNILKGHVKRLCNYFQDVLPKKEYTDAFKVIIAKNKARRAPEMTKSDPSPTITTNNFIRDVGTKLSSSRLVDGSSRPKVGLIELAQHLARHRHNPKMLTTHQEALAFLEKEEISYNNAVMVMHSSTQDVPTRQVFNWKTAMKAMCSGTDIPDTPDMSALENDDVFGIYIQLPLDAPMREFLRNCGFVIDENGTPVLDDDDGIQYDGAHLYILPSKVQNQEQTHEFLVDIKTGPITPAVSHDPESFKEYDLHMNKITTEPDVVPDLDEEDDFEKAMAGDEFLQSRLDAIDSFANDIFRNADPQNFYQVIEDMRKLMPEECDGKQGDVVDISTVRREENAEGFGWFLNDSEAMASTAPEHGDGQTDPLREMLLVFKNHRTTQFDWLDDAEPTL